MFSYLLLLALAVVSLACVWSGKGRHAWVRTAGWFGLALAGQWSWLLLIDAGRLLHFQHLRSPGQIRDSGGAMLLAVLAVQAAGVVGGLVGARERVRRTVRFGKMWQWLAFALVVAISGAALSREPHAMAYEFAAAFAFHLVLLANLALLAGSIPAEATSRLRSRFGLFRLAEPGNDHSAPRIDRMAVAAAVWVTTVTALLSYFVYEAHPHVPDEVCYFLQARYFAAGKLELPAPPVPEAFELFLIQSENGRAFSCFPPGWPLMLAAGMAVGLPWMVNPALAGLCVLGTYKLLWHLYHRSLARLAILLLCCSPWFLFMGMNWMAHTATLACALAGALAVLRAGQGNPWWCVPAGACTAVTGLIRPYDGFLLGVLLASWILFSRRFARKPLLISILAISAGVLSSAVLPYNEHFTGSPLKFPVEEYFSRKFAPGANSMGFGSDKGLPWSIDPFPGHSPVEAAINTLLNVFSVNAELFGWGFGSLILLGGGLIAGWFTKRDLPMLAVLLAFPIAFSLYWYSGGPDFGARYWYVILVPCVALSVRALEQLATALRREYPDSGVRVIAGVLVVSALTVCAYMPWRITDKYHRYLNMAPDVPELARLHSFGRSLVMIRGAEHPDYASAIPYNPLDFGESSSGPVYVRETTPDARERLRRAYPDRPVWVLNGPSITGRGYEIVERPHSEQAATSRGSK